MRYPYCDSQNTRVLHTRRNAEDKRTYRRNECNDCGEMFSTIEIYREEYLQAKHNQRKLNNIAEFLITGGK